MNFKIINLHKTKFYVMNSYYRNTKKKKKKKRKKENKNIIYITCQ